MLCRLMNCADSTDIWRRKPHLDQNCGRGSVLADREKSGKYIKLGNHTVL